MNGYKCFYNGRMWEVVAATSYAAHLRAVEHFKVPRKREHMISVVLCEKEGGEVVEHSTSEIG